MLRKHAFLATFTSLAVLLTITSFVIFGERFRALPQLTSFGKPRATNEVRPHDLTAPPARETASDEEENLLKGFGIDPNAWKHGKDVGTFKEPKVDAQSPYALGKLKAPGSNYTRTLVMPKLLRENTSWVQEELRDLLESSLLKTAVYVMDDPTAPLHPIANKGREVMAYLSYIIDHYDSLADITMFMHSHRHAWHNNVLMDEDSSLMVRHLSPERVTREGYMNMRCQWDPGCPDWLHPTTVNFDEHKPEERFLFESWTELFPSVQIPTTLAQPCGAQFAVSRERILSIPRVRFISLRNWLLRTDLDDFLSGRIFEYTWQFIFSSSPLHCPSMSACYCDGYGLCFGDAEKFDHYFELMHYLKRYQDELDDLNEKVRSAAEADSVPDAEELSGADVKQLPDSGREKWLKRKVEEMQSDMRQRKENAWKMGRDARQRAKEAGRVWKDGDGTSIEPRH